MSAAPPATTYTYRSNVGTGARYGFGQHGGGLGRLRVVGPKCACAVCLVLFGVFFLLVGTIMTVTSYTGFQQEDEFFHDSPTRTIGPIFLVLGFISVLVGVGLCCAARRQAGSGLTTTTQQYSAPGPAPATVGYNPTGYTPSAQSGYNPSGQPPYNPAGQPPYNPAGQPPYNQSPYNPSGQPSYNPAGQPPYNQPPYNPSSQPPYNPAGQPPYNPSGQPPYNPAGSSQYPLGDQAPPQPTKGQPSAPPGEKDLPPPPAYSDVVGKQ